MGGQRGATDRELIERIRALAAVEGGRAVFGAAHHRWSLASPWPEERIAEFERRHGGVLPGGYRHWIGNVGAGGAGPGTGLFEPGTVDTGGGPEPWSRRFGPLGKAFPCSETAGRTRGKLPGAMPIAEIGCGTLILLVTGGDQAGRIWVDDRANRSGLQPEGDLDFDGWIEMWLGAAEREARDPWKPAPAHPNEPDEIIQAAEILESDQVDTWATGVLRALADQDRVEVGELGLFRQRGKAVHFDQSDRLRKATEPGDVPGEGVAADIFREVFRRAPWVAVEVPGLFLSWIAERRPGEGRDYLGRPFVIGGHRRFLVVRTCSA